MLGTSLQFAKSNGDDWFYDAAKARRSSQRPRSATAAPLEKRAGSEEPAKAATATVPASSSNLDRFLEYTTPSVPAQYFSKFWSVHHTSPSVGGISGGGPELAGGQWAAVMCQGGLRGHSLWAKYHFRSGFDGFWIVQMRMRGWRSCDAEQRPYFLLADLWESFKEWSAYGAGVPLVLNGSGSVIQYYVPYLSGIELYGHSLARHDTSRRQLGEDSDGDCFRDSSSDGSSDCELDSVLKYARDWGQNHIVDTSTTGMDRLSLREDRISLQEGFLSDDSDSGNSQGCLLFQYLERNPPYSREPLADKMSDLARSFPELKTYRSCDLLPESWISVAWYPIYRIPTGPTLKDLDACFLTFHSLSTPMAGATATAASPTIAYQYGIGGVSNSKIPLCSFGLASYKFKGPLWTPTGGCEKQLASSLLQAADNWLRLLNVDHPDYRFFTSHGAFLR